MKYILCLSVLLALTACGKKQGPASPPASRAPAAQEIEHYTCTMHPSVRSKDPGKCPICSMDLVPVYKKGSQPADAPSVFNIPTTRQQQIGVSFATAERKKLTRSIRAAGLVTYDKQRHWDYIARTDGYVQELHVSSRGERVDKGQPLLTLYSPDLLSTQREYIELLKLRDAGQDLETMIASAKRRLQLWNIADGQIAELERTRAPTDLLTLASPFAGVVQDIPVDQGRRVMAGDHLVDVVDLSVVWVWAEFYQDELSLLRTGQVVTVSSSSYPNQGFDGYVQVMDPFLDEMKRTGRVRIDVHNADLKLRPEMYVDVELELAAQDALAVPVGAVMPTGERFIVYVDKGDGRLEPRFVKIAGKFGDDYAVKSGLTAGERVVAGANFLVDAEAKIQGALSSW